VDATTGATIFPPRWWQTLFSKKKIIQRLITDRDGLVAGGPILSVAGIAKQAASLYDNLERLGYTEANRNLVAVGWDWRKGIDDTLVQSAIARAIDGCGRATIVAHSTGGLVARAFLEANPAHAAKIDQLIAFAVPWNGTLDAMAAMEGQVSLQVAGIFGFNASEVQQIVKTCKAAYDLLPPATPAPKTIANAPPIVNVCGWGAETIDAYSVVNGVVTFARSKSGDGTVPFASSSWLDAPREFYVPVGAYEVNAIPEKHPHIWDSPPVIELLDELVGTAARKPFIAAAVDSDDNFPSVDPVRVRIAAQDENGGALPNGTVSLLNQSWPIAKRLDINLPRAALTNNANGYARVTISVDWTGGSAKTAIAVRMV